MSRHHLFVGQHTILSTLFRIRRKHTQRSVALVALLLLVVVPGWVGAQHHDPGAGATSAAILAATVAHPRIWLDPATLATLRQRAAKNTREWTALKAQCDRYLTGTVEWPDGNDYPDGGSIGEGYQGDGYIHNLLNTGLCYQTIGASSPSKAAYGAKGVDILLKMSAPPPSAHAPEPLRDDGYGIRNFGIGMAIGYDWLYPALTVAQRQRVYTALNRWIAAFDTGGFGNNHPQGNYFAGYYAAKALAALATEGDNPSAPAQWNDWLTRLHGKMVQPYYAVSMRGGGWPEGWNYGQLGTVNMSLPILAAKTAKGLDLIGGAKPFAFPVDQGLHLIHFTWPNRTTLDDRGALYAGDNPSGIRASLLTTQAGLMRSFNAASAPYFQRFAREAKALVDPTTGEGWQEFLFWDPAAPESDYRLLPQSYWSRGMGLVAARSSWANNAVWMSFSAAPYINNPDSGEEFYDQGAPIIVRGGTPLLVDAIGALLRYTPGTNDGDAFEERIYDDNYGNNDADPALANRTLYNIFYVKTGNYGQIEREPTETRTAITRFEDGGGYVYMRGSNLEDMYRPDPATDVSPVKSWTREIIFLRPGTVVIYDRTTVANAAQDQFQAFHLPRTPVAVTSATGTHRYDVRNGTTFAGAVTTLLPINQTTRIVNVFGSNKVYRLEVRPGARSVTQRWLTVFDASASSAATAKALRLSATDGNVQAGSVVGTLLQGPTSNSVALVGTVSATQNVVGEIRYVVPARSTTHVITGLPANAAYAVSVGVAGGKHTVRVVPGSGLKSSPMGVLAFNVSASGTLASTASFTAYIPVAEAK